MAEARQSSEWARAAAIKATLININRDKAKHPQPLPDDLFNPYAKLPPPAPPQKVDIAILKTIFVDNFRD